MAEGWIKMRTDLYRDPKVILIADHLMDAESDLSRFISQHTQRDSNVTRNVMRNATVGALVTVWGVARTQGKRVGDDLLIPDVTVSVLDDISDMPGFGEAMESVGWVVGSELGLQFPRFFEEHNTDYEEQKRKNRERQARYRNNKKRNVTETLRNAPEKRREEKSIDLPKGKSNRGKFRKPTVEEVAAYCSERKNIVDPQQFWDFYESKGWMVGKNRMKDWKAAVRNWEKSDSSRGSPSATKDRQSEEFQKFMESES